MFGHTQEDCRKLVSQRQEWKAKTQVSASGQQQQPEENEPGGEEGFQLATRHITGHQCTRSEAQGSLAPTIEKLIANTFSVLLEEEEGDQAKGGEGGHTPNG